MTNEIYKMSQEEYEDCDEDSLQPIAFQVSPANPNENLSLPPMDGEQYLRRVMNEAKNCPGIKIAEVIPRKHNPTLPILPEPCVKTCNSKLLPTKAWQTSAMADFSKLRLNVDKLRQKLTDDPVLLAFAKKIPQVKKDESKWLQVVGKPRTPATRLCLAIDQVNLWHLLAHFDRWMRDRKIGVLVGCRWVYCLLACMEMPVLSDVYFTLRQIARFLIDYREKHIDSAESDVLPHINLLVCVVGRYFHQYDLADP